MENQRAINDFVSRYRGEYDDATIRERLAADGCAPEQIDEAFRAQERGRAEESRELAFVAKLLIAAGIVGALGVWGAMRLSSPTDQPPPVGVRRLK